MHASWSVVLTSLLAAAAANPVKRQGGFKPNFPRHPDFPLDIVDKLEEATWPKIEAFMASRKVKRADGTPCTLENASVRREWNDLSIDARKEYIDAVLCLQKKPSKAVNIPGALNRYDDFVATHMTLVNMLHSPTNLFGSHRYYIWAFEKALRDECGYTGYQPYMNYNRLVDDPENSAMFNGNATSMGGNGVYDQYRGVPQGFPAPYNIIPAADGGGCVKDGPFKDMVVSLGPVGVVVNNIPKNPQRNGLGSNPRCLRRDINKASAMGATANHTYSLIMEYPDITAFYNRYLGQPFLRGDQYPWGLHSAGHYIIGGDPGGDFYASPGDPAFWFHHGMLDRVWWLWQMQEPETRLKDIPMAAMMAGRNGNAANIEDTIVDLGWTAPARTLGSLQDTLGGADGDFCYIYL